MDEGLFFLVWKLLTYSYLNKVLGFLFYQDIGGGENGNRKLSVKWLFWKYLAIIGPRMYIPR